MRGDKKRNQESYQEYVNQAPPRIMPKEYYKTHCVQCGNSISTEDMQFNLKEALKIYANTILNNKDESSRALNNMEYSWVSVWKNVIEDLKIPFLVGNLVLCRSYEVFEDDLESGKNSGTLTIRMSDLQYILGEPLGMPGWHMTEEPDPEIFSKIRQFYGNESVEVETWKDLWWLLQDHKDAVILEADVTRWVEHNDMDASFVKSIRLKFGGIYGGDVTAFGCCPRCGNTLNSRAGKYEEIVIGMIGSARVGKTAYLAALMSKLKNGLAVRLALGEGDNDPASENVLEAYRRGERVEKTDLAGNEIPLFYQVIEVGRKRFAFTFVDMPGEVFVPGDNNQIQQAREALMKRQILGCVDAIWFCLDSSQVEPSLMVFREGGQDPVLTDLDKVISGILNCYQTIHEDRSRLPAAVMITRSDELEDVGLFFPGEEEGSNAERVCLFDNTPEMQSLDDAELHWQVYENGLAPYFWVERALIHSEDTKRYVQSKVPQLTSRLQDYFKVNYFPVAAYGHPVLADAPEPPMPSGIRVPFYWTLAALAKIPPVEERWETVEVRKKTLFKPAIYEDRSYLQGVPEKLYI